MTAKSGPHFWLECDECGAKSTDGNKTSVWCGLSVVEDRHYCSNCQDECPACESRCKPKTMEACPDCQLALTTGGEV